MLISPLGISKILFYPILSMHSSEVVLHRFDGIRIRREEVGSELHGVAFLIISLQFFGVFFSRYVYQYYILIRNRNRTEM